FWAPAGLLMSYSTDIDDGLRRVGFQIAKIIRGAKPGELPIEQAVKFTLAINQKTARQLGITPSATLLAQAEEVIESAASPHENLLRLRHDHAQGAFQRSFADAPACGAFPRI